MRSAVRGAEIIQSCLYHTAKNSLLNQLYHKVVFLNECAVDCAANMGVNQI